MIFKKKIINYFEDRFKESLDTNTLNIARSLEFNFSKIYEINNLGDIEFKCFSQFGDDGIISWLLNSINKIDNKEINFYEFGCGNLDESNSKYSILSKNLKATLVDANKDNIERIKRSYIYQKYDIFPIDSFITPDNVNDYLFENNFLNILSLDIDGIDFWVSRKINFQKFNIDIFICEFNPIFGYDKAYSIPYCHNFNRWDYSNLGNLYGASIQAFKKLMKNRNFTFIGTNTSGNNAYFLNNTHQSIIKNIDESKIFKRKFIDIIYKKDLDKNNYTNLEKSILNQSKDKFVEIMNEDCDLL